MFLVIVSFIGLNAKLLGSALKISTEQEIISNAGFIPNLSREDLNCTKNTCFDYANCIYYPLDRVICQCKCGYYDGSIFSPFYPCKRMDPEKSLTFLIGWVFPYRIRSRMKEENLHGFLFEFTYWFISEMFNHLEGHYFRSDISPGHMYAIDKRL